MDKQTQLNYKIFKEMDIGNFVKLCVVCSASEDGRWPPVWFDIQVGSAFYYHGVLTGSVTITLNDLIYKKWEEALAELRKFNYS